MTTVIINPGTGPVSGATLRAAWKAARHLRRDSGRMGSRLRRRPSGDSEGRYGFWLGRDTLDVPGVSLERLQSGDLFAPRFYVNGSSWWWTSAVAVLQPERL